MGKLLLMLSLIFLASCTTINHPCLNLALTEAEQVQNKDKLLFVEGVYNHLISGRHVQLWIIEKGKYRQLTGGFIEERWFRATDYFNYKGYIKRVERYGWLK